MRIPVAVLLLPLFAGVAACSAPERAHIPSEEPWVQVAEEAALSRWVAETVPLWDLSKGTDGVLFAELLDIAFDQAGSLVIADHRAARVHFVTPDGIPGRAVGRVGSGPGELHSIDGFGVSAGGRIWGYDAARRRLVVFGANERDTLTTSLQSLGSRAWPMVAGMVTDEEFFIIETHLPMLAGPSGKLLRDSTRLVRYSISEGRSARPQSIATRPREDLFIHPSGRSLRRVDFGPRLSVVVDPVRHRAYWGFSDALMIERWTPDGVIAPFLDHPVRTRAVGAAERESILRSAEQLTADVSNDLSERLPAFERLVVATDGCLWVKEYQPGQDGPTRWAVFDTVGVLRRIVDLPARFDLRAVNGDSAAGITEDRWGEQFVRVLRLVEVPKQ